MKLKSYLAASLNPLYSTIVAAMAISGGQAFAAATATDTAANYSGIWGTPYPNDGAGFGSWNITLNNADNPPYVGTYLDTSSAVATGGYSWATYANGTGDNGSISISRAFSDGLSGSASLFNQSFSFDLSSGGVGNGSGGPPNSDLSVAIGDAFLFQYLGTGSDNFTLNGNTTTVGFAALNAGIHVSLAVSGILDSPSEAYTFTVTPFSGGVPLYTTSGTFDSSTLDTSSFNYLDQNTTGNCYFNNLNITAEAVPEPASMALLGISGLATLLIARRQK